MQRDLAVFDDLKPAASPTTRLSKWLATAGLVAVIGQREHTAARVG
jgi:hypothetical protein